MPRSATVAPAAPPKVNVSVDMPSTQPAEPPEKEEKSPTWYWDTLQEIPKEAWGNIYDVMGFRLDPQAGRQAGAKGFLFQVFEPITLNWIKQNYGGGRFRCILQKNSKFFKSHEFEVDGAPKYDLTREVPHGPVNGNNGNSAAEFQKEFISVLREELSRSREQNQGTTQGTDKVVEMLTNASEKAMEIVTKQTPQATSGVSQVRELVSALKEMGILGAQPQAGGGGVVETIKVLKELGLIGGDPMGQVTMFLTIFEKLDALRGGGGDGGGRAKDWRAMLAEGAVQKAPEILKEVREIVQENRHTATERRAAAEAIREVEQIRRGAPVTPATVAPAAPPAPTAAPSGPLRTVPIDRSDVNKSVHSEPAASTIVDTPPAAPGMSQTESDAVANFMERRIVEMVEDERDAEDVVDFIEEIDPTMNNMLAQFSAEIVTTFLAGRVIIGKATKHPRWPEFLANAQKYIREIRAEDAAIDAASTRVPA